MEDRIMVYKKHGVNILVSDILKSFTMSMRDVNKDVIASFLESVMIILQENRGNEDLTMERLFKVFDSYTEKFIRRVA